jgi:hypothetical protein
MISCPATNIPATLFLHWLNQSYNTACNYANRAGAEQSEFEFNLCVSASCFIYCHCFYLLKQFNIMLSCILLINYVCLHVILVAKSLILIPVSLLRYGSHCQGVRSGGHVGLCVCLWIRYFLWVYTVCFIVYYVICFRFVFDLWIRC